MSKVNQQDIDKLIELVGGRGNIATVSHCITRLRFVLNDPAQAAVISASNGEFITARDWNDTAAEQITALQNAGCDAILAIASTAPAGDWQKALLSQGVTAIIDGTTAENGTNVLGADLGLTGVAQLDLVFTQGGGCRVEIDAIAVKPGR